MQTLKFLACLFLAAALAAPLMAQEAGRYVPAQTTIAILPVLNKSGGDWQSLKDRQTEKAQGELARQFKQSGFPLADAAAVANALADQNLKAGDPSAYTPQALAEIGRASQADLVALLVITDTHQGFRHGLSQLFGQQREGEAKVHLWLVDAQTGAAIVNGPETAGKARGNPLANGIFHGLGQGGSDYTIRAVGDAVGLSLRDFLSPSSPK